MVELERQSLAVLMRGRSRLLVLADAVAVLPPSEWRSLQWASIDGAQWRLRHEIARRQGMCEGAREHVGSRVLVG